MQLSAEGKQEWQQGWRIVLGATICSGLGIPLFYYVFSLFTDGIIAELHVTRGELSNAQALLVVGALCAPLIGRWLDHAGFPRVFAICMLAVVAAHFLLATYVTTLVQLALLTFIYGAAGAGCGPLAYTRPINAWFLHSRGLALGMASAGLAIATFFGAPLLAALIAEEGWRAGAVALGLISLLLCLPLSIWLMRGEPPEDLTEAARAATSARPDHRYKQDRDFWLLIGSIFCIGFAGSGLVSQLAPIMREEGVTLKLAAFGISAYAVGQLSGRIIAGWFLDHANPRRVAFAFTAVPALGFVLLAGFDLPFWAGILAVGAIGIQQGAEIDLFAWFIARRFGLLQYGRIYGWIIAGSWIGNATGIVSFARLHDARGNFATAEWIAAGALVIGAVLIAAVRVSALPHVGRGDSAPLENLESAVPN